jgi:uncharacterized damage-inducible protein DinB
MKNDTILRKELVALLQGGNAHDGVIAKLINFPQNKINQTLSGFVTPNENFMSPWQLLEHMRVCQQDILEFIQNPNYKERSFPDEYWSVEAELVNRDKWSKSLKSFQKDLEALIKIAKDVNVDLFAPMAYGINFNIFRELLLVADHNSYHLGQIGLFEDV